MRANRTEINSETKMNKPLFLKVTFREINLISDKTWNDSKNIELLQKLQKLFNTLFNTIKQ